jgi:hypothetical protein
MLNIRTVPSFITQAHSSKMTGALALLSLSLVPSLGSAAIYKCTAQDGGITYTDQPCAPDTKTQTIDSAKPTWLIESSPTLSATALAVDDNLESQPNALAALCAADEFSFWLKAQRGPLPDRDVRTAIFIKLSRLCRSALHLPI